MLSSLASTRALRQVFCVRCARQRCVPVTAISLGRQAQGTRTHVSYPHGLRPDLSSASFSCSARVCSASVVTHRRRVPRFMSFVCKPDQEKEDRHGFGDAKETYCATSQPGRRSPPWHCPRLCSRRRQLRYCPRRSLLPPTPIRPSLRHQVEQMPYRQPHYLPNTPLNTANRGSAEPTVACFTTFMTRSGLTGFPRSMGRPSTAPPRS